MVRHLDINGSGIDRLDPGRVLGGPWARCLDTLSEGAQEDPHFAQLRAPFTREFPGLAPSGGAPLTPAERQQALDVLLPEMRLTSLPQPTARMAVKSTILAAYAPLASPARRAAAPISANPASLRSNRPCASA